MYQEKIRWSTGNYNICVNNESKVLKRKNNEFYQQYNQVLPSYFDWREQGIITPVKYQDTCGGCWTFATTGVIESQYALKYNKLVNFSEQQLIDCDSINDGCRGGLMTDAYKAIQEMGGLETSEDYGEYLNSKGQCKIDSNKVSAKVINWYQISEDEEAIRRELVQNGPIAVGVNARFLQFYQGGILDPKLCDDSINHAVLIVGYGEENGKKYWIIKNQWGKSWGINGYFKLVRGKKQCGVHTYASIAFIE
ncbi:papain family cysteine protease, putative [Ichthyophthirius multifiliis]|uniref:Papain family cysteine protease, putative n=1 Tax=Ichthyophthirius multifiliis TaxID=5932 RepID=G0QU95_ICHMU|nr:papain family cysteine protease, putative [Ichthyophthirius multifiliis]EGR31212.1 papain family cysteine protease, putative [Ichthyophthirius multifiliis]|eukprot:XP_004034698.1 papain family cysteine protease, putative [Ichthyophthirius multifiliis]